MNKETSNNESRYRITGTPGGDLVFCDGPRELEMAWKCKSSKGKADITLFAITVQKWRYPYDHEPITDELREHILSETKRLIEAQGAREGGRVSVVINRTDIEGCDDPY